MPAIGVQRVGFIGLGEIGLPAATNLIQYESLTRAEFQQMTPDLLDRCKTRSSRRSRTPASRSATSTTSSSSAAPPGCRPSSTSSAS